MHKIDKARRNLLGLGCMSFFAVGSRAWPAGATQTIPEQKIKYKKGGAQTDLFARIEIRKAVSNTFPEDFPADSRKSSFQNALGGAKEEIFFKSDVSPCFNPFTLGPTIIWSESPVAKLLVLDPFFDQTFVCEKPTNPVVLTASLSSEVQSITVRRVMAGYNAFVDIQRTFGDRVVTDPALEHTLLAIGKTASGSIVKGIGKYYTCTWADGHCGGP